MTTEAVPSVKPHRGIPMGGMCTDSDCWCYSATENPDHPANHRRHCVPRVWVVLDESGQPDYCAMYPEACHEHINNACAEHIEGASRWIVREYRLHEQ